MNVLRSNGLRRFLRYASIGISTFLFDLLLIYIATDLFGVPYYISTPVCFWIALTLNYALARKFVFKGTERRVHHGYGYYIIGGVAGAFAITTSVTFLVEVVGIHYLIARTLVSGTLGFCGYLFNLYVNFKVVGKH